MMKPGNTTMRGVLAAVFLGLLALYALTAQRGVSWQDSGEFQRRARVGDLAGVEGVARAHPLYVACLHALTRTFPPSADLWAINAFSGLGMAVAAAVCVWLVWRMTGHTLASVGAGLLLGLSHMAWWMATAAEVYTWSLALLLMETAALYALIARPQPRTLWWLALISGIGLSVHNFALLSLPVWAMAAGWLMWRRALPVWAVGPAVVAWLAGASAFLALVAGSAFGSGRLAEALRDALFGGYQVQVLGLAPTLSWTLLIANLALFALSLASPLWVAAADGWRGIRHLEPRVFSVCLVALSGIHVLFFVRYFVPDQATFCLPTLGVASLWVGVGLAVRFERSGWPARTQVALVVAGLACLLAVPVGLATLARMYAWEPPRARVIPFRDEARYWLLPWKQAEHSADDFARAVHAQCGRNDVIYADSTAAGPLTVALLTKNEWQENPLVVTYYDRWTGDHEAWQAFLRRVAARPFYVVSPVPGYVPDSLLNGDFAFVKTGVLYRVHSNSHDGAETPYGVTTNGLETAKRRL
ncbi:MAG: hypothetical protein ACOYOU_07310 [Kiritimatiellia bacterium]